MPRFDEPTRALRRLLRADPELAGEPRRLGRGLLDLLPHDDRAVRLLALGAELGVPALVAQGRPADARRALIDRAGLHPEAAGWVVETWRAAGGEDPAGGFGPVRLAAWPDGTLLVVTREERGVFGATVGASGPSQWRLLAPSAGPGGLAVSMEGERVVVAWPQAGGVYACEAYRGDGAFGAAPPELVAEERPGLTPGAPFTFVAVDETLNQFVWPLNGGRMRRGTWRAWPSDEPDENLPSVGATVSTLDVGRPAPDVAVLVATTVDGRVLTAEWNLSSGHVAAWRETERPGAATAAGDTAWLATVAADMLTLSRPGAGAVWSLRAP
ncbi:hypothetical protein [Paractinoplanes atraurantiacus]|uniref:Uncharacterized protein n=1 Tax=Paractinoplanes atraurantiacus TaxID=1036182 RepID=A0A285JY85_9ACTN|nr:hypothetical protein [Actinoplanes atraurantiacus]SNY65275.1 hypothetical protein SAMN05421748_12816 [Actinoplanes atraurantiacus]